MENQAVNDDAKRIFTEQEKVLALFTFIEELNKLKQRIIFNISDYPWYHSIKDLPQDTENIKVFYRDRVEVENVGADNTENILLSVHKPEFSRCPEPDENIKKWLEPGWDDYHNKIVVKKILTSLSGEKDGKKRIDIENEPEKEYFDDDENRKVSLNIWKENRQKWVEKQKKIAETRDFFSELYKVCIDLERDSETLELIVADGFVKNRDIPKLNHPILTRRVNIRHDAVNNTIYIEDASVDTELYTAIFQNMDEVNLSSINHMREDLHYNDYHPLDRNDLPVFLKAFIHQLSSESSYYENIPNDWQGEDKVIIYRNPCYILRKRMDGTLKAIRQIIEHIEKTSDIPAPIRDIVEGGKINIKEDVEEISIEEQLAAVGGESIDILLSKEANKEQLEIARRIEKYNAVLVQGPPGTGKTHTIANLMGHFLAQGKSVLVTSHTQKALKVLKEKIVPGLQSLCVSMLDDSNVDMEKSIDGITRYMSQHTSFDLKKEMESLYHTRKQIIEELANTRKKLYSIINQEANNIVFNGEAISPSKAAKFVQDNCESLSYIPGSVQLYEPIPLSLKELSELYQSNRLITSEDELEFDHDLPNPQSIMIPNEFEEKCNKLCTLETHLKIISEKNGWNIENVLLEKKIVIDGYFGKLILNYPEVNSLIQLKNYVSSFPKVETWMKHCAVDGSKGNTYKQLWIRLIEKIQETSKFAETLAVEKFGKTVIISNQSPDFEIAMEQLLKKYKQGGKLNKLALVFNKQLDVALNGATINGYQPKTVEDCQLILHTIRMNSLRNQCALFWNDLIAKYDVPVFYDLDKDEPERVAANYIPYIQRYLNWFQNEYEELKDHLKEVGIPCDLIFQKNILDSEITSAEKILNALGDSIPKICEVLELTLNIADLQDEFTKNLTFLQIGKRANSQICKTLINSILDYNVKKYREFYLILEEVYEKKNIKQKREYYLNRLSLVAPQWASAISNRNGIHGKETVPEDILDAWKWKQYNGIIESIVSEPFVDLQKQSVTLSRKYREITAKYAEKSAWYNLLRRTENDISLKQALVGWKQTVKKIGKGTGKNAPKYRAYARKLMSKCQNAVPAWVMPIGKALETLNPSVNQFDIVIIDEASQSDISSFAILYMGKKLIIVGDDKQVSPMAVGVQLDKMNALNEMYISGKIPNDHLYDAKTSIYDIAATTFQPLMLREHFRCVPEIIGFSNWLSYDFKIQPLRDCSNNTLIPSVVNYRVADGERIGKTNPKEAKCIVALMKSCIEQPEYANKTFGVISLLGDEQVKIIQEEIYSQIDSKVVNERKILCGNASNFQGDERDVIFLSLVDCTNGNGPLPKQGFGIEDAYRKRYNVAASRARDQLWVVDSLDPINDLKPGDIRKMLIDYSLNPQSVLINKEKVEKNSDSPFEASVANFLIKRGYHIVQQWKVGAYRLDIVVICGQNKIAIECDGERWHSGENKIREDMERQTILERLGWRFIRIRGSEYYRSPIKTMERVICDLTRNGIEPENDSNSLNLNDEDFELLQRIKRRAYSIINQHNEDNEIRKTIIEAALDPKNDIIGETIKKGKQSQISDNNYDFKLNERNKEQQPTKKTNYKKITKGISNSNAPLDDSKKKNYDKVYSYFSAIRNCNLVSPLDDESISKTDNSSSFDIIKFFSERGVQYIDKRKNGGSLWVVGGYELSELLRIPAQFGYTFHFKKEGGRVTKNQPAWWSK